MSLQSESEVNVTHTFGYPRLPTSTVGAPRVFSFEGHTPWARVRHLSLAPSSSEALILPKRLSSLLPGGGRHRWYGLHIRARQEQSISTGPLLLRVLGPLYRVGWRPSTMLLHTFRFTRFRPILCVRADSSYLPPRHPQLPAEACPIHLPVRPK